MVLGCDAAGDQRKAPETAPYGLLAVLALIAAGVDLDLAHSHFHPPVRSSSLRARS
jgi:hypothetical protein